MDQLTALYLILTVLCLIGMAFVYFKYFRHHHRSTHR